MNQRWKRRLLGGGATLALACAAVAPSAFAQTSAQSQAQAQTQAITQSQAQQPAATRVGVLPPGPGDRAIGDNGFYLEADTVARDDEHHTWTATGSVEARYQGKVLRTNSLEFNQDTGVVVARGDVQLLSPDGTSEFAKVMTMDKDFRSGVALAFSTRQQPNTKIVADESIRLSEDANELNKAVFTVCDICAADGTPKEPTWSIQASRVIQDHKLRIIYYKNVVIRVAGLPVMALPIFWHVDPSAKRGSGLLAPRFALDGRRGFSYEQPYLWVIDPYSDLIISPQFNANVAPLLNTEYRKRFYSGQIDVRAGYTYAQQFGDHGIQYDNLTSRSYILASGAFVLNDKWAWGFSAERATDPLLFQRYGVPNAFDARGLLPTDDQRLTSQIYAVEQSNRSYFSIDALSIQGLRPGDLNGTFPLIAPLIEAHFEPDMRILGGRLRVDGGGVLLDRARDVTTDTAPGEDSRRASVGGDWRSSYTFYNGIRLEPFVTARADLYNVNGLSVTDTGLHTTGRALGTVGVDGSWPFFRRTKDLTVVLEPLAQLAVSPRATTNPNIPNEDSQVIDFDETNLFEANKSPGFDYYEGGARANLGGRATFRWDSGPQAQFLIGRSLRTEPDPTLPARTSLNQTASDWVVAASAQPGHGLSGYTRALVDGETSAIRRLEVGSSWSNPLVSLGVSYFRDNIDVVGAKTENAQIGGGFKFTKHMGISGSQLLDLTTHTPVATSIALTYQDECIHWEFFYSHNGTFNRTLGPSSTFGIRLLLVTLGSTGYQRPDFR